jgi:hypothetical protein
VGGTLAKIVRVPGRTPNSSSHAARQKNEGQENEMEEEKMEKKIRGKEDEGTGRE